MCAAVASGPDAPPTFHPGKQVLDLVALAVQLLVVRVLPICKRWPRSAVDIISGATGTTLGALFKNEFSRLRTH
jgi:hypothetical protein